MARTRSRQFPLSRALLATVPSLATFRSSMVRLYLLILVFPVPVPVCLLWSKSTLFSPAGHLEYAVSFRLDVFHVPAAVVDGTIYSQTVSNRRPCGFRMYVDDISS